MPIGPVLKRFVDDELERAPALIERALSGTLRLLLDTKDSPLGAGERAHQLAIVEALQTRAHAYRNEFVRALHTGVQAVLEEQQHGLPPEAAASCGELELMDESRVEVDIELSRAMQLIDTTAEWELRELQTFTSTLVGHTHVNAESNPFRPLVYATALWRAACVVSPVQVQRATLLRVSAGVASGLLKSAWAAACTRLEAQGVEPGMYRSVLLAPGAVAGRGPAPEDASQAGAIANLLARMPGGATSIQVGVGNAAVAMGTPAPRPGAARSARPSPEFEEALTRLDELLRHLPQAGPMAGPSAESLAKRLELHRAALIASAATPIERQIIELLSRVFDTLLADAQIAQGYFTALARLQASALRIALRDPEMIDSTEHPVWRLIDRIGQGACAYPQASDARAGALLAFCHTLTEQLAQTTVPDAAAYRRALAQLDAYLADQMLAQLRAASGTLQALQLAEKRALLEQRLAQRLVDQMVPARTTPGVRRFMTGTWARVLAEAMLRHGEQALITRGYIKLVDELLWSVQLPDHPRSRQRLVTLLPDMLKRLRMGMESIGLPAPEQEAMLDELMTIHTEALRPAGRADPGALSADQIVQRMRDEVLPASTGHGGFTDSVIDLESMETVPASVLPAEGAGDATTRRAEALLEGDLLRMFVQGRWARVQLLWRSDRRLFFLFAGEVAPRTHSITHRALERLSSAGLVQPLELRPLVQRSLDRVARELVRQA